MRFLRNLGLGDRFRIAEPNKLSCNNRPINRGQVLKVEKIFPQTPNVYVCYLSGSKHKGIFTLLPGTPVLFPNEPTPTDEEVRNFITGKPRLRVVGYRCTWDGKTDLADVLQPQAIAIIKMMYSLGRPIFEASSLHKLCNTHFEKFFGRRAKVDGSKVFTYYRRLLVNRGLLEEVIDDSPVSLNEQEASYGKESDG